MLVTLRDCPADAEIISHQLLLRGGYIRRVTSGVYAYLPLMWRVLNKITKIVQEEMDAAGCLQTLLPQLHPSEPWKKSGRWQGYTAGEGIMFHLIDRQQRELGLGPTHEEVITTIAKDLIKSYKQLPITLYQIQTKFRDEIRPRFGLMRSREFIMKDAYSFHIHETDLRETYKNMHNVYKNIFKRCGVDVVGVDADSGSIGGASSLEFMVTADSGEDLILTSSDGLYSANQEKAISIPSDPNTLSKGDSKIINTPNASSIQDLCKQQNIYSDQIVKVILMLAETDEKKKQPLLISIRGDQLINEVKLKNVATNKIGKSLVNLEKITPQLVEEEGLGEFPFGFIGPDLDDSILKNAKTWEPNFLRLADETALGINVFVSGANKIDFHHAYMEWKALSRLPEKVDIRAAKDGDRCVHDPNEKLKQCRGIEVGHIFQLGTKYSEALEASFTNEKGVQEPLWMGCYGIGVSRLAQASIEQHHDQFGISWPISIAPFEVIVVIANLKDDVQVKLAEKIYMDLKMESIDVLLDDRDERAGVKFKDADLIGIPFKLIVGRDAAENKVELVTRSSQNKETLNADEAKKILSNKIFANKT